MRIGLCQYDAASGNFQENLAKVERGLKQAERDRLEIVCFPECFLTGYQDQEVRAPRSTPLPPIRRRSCSCSTAPASSTPR